MKISTTITNCKKTAFAFLAVLFCLAISNKNLLAQSLANGGFEANTTYPGTGWSGSGNMTSGTIATTGSRTGVNNLTTTFNNNQGYDSYITNSNTVTVASNNYLHVIAWAKVSLVNANNIIWFSATNSNLGPGSTLTTSFAQYSANFKNTGNANTGISSSSPKPQIGFNTSGFTNRTFNLDDVVAYTDANTTSDLTAPGAASGFTNGAITSSSVSFTWTNGTDATAPVTNVQGVIVLRTTNTAAPAPTLNNQGIYSVAGGTSGPNLDQTGNWNIISIGAASNGSAGSYTDNTVTAGTTYKYAVINYDLAYNYSTALTSGNIAISATPTITSFTPTSACLGSTPTITITGTNFTGATAVKFNGVNATSFLVVSATSITAVLPSSGVSTGQITVTTPGGTATSGTSFLISTSAPATVTYSSNPATYCAGQIITANNPTTTSGGAPTSYSVSPALPAGLTLNTSTGVITGNPTTTGGVATATYTVTSTNSCGSTTTGVSITISPAAPSGLTYTTNPANYCVGTAITNNTPSLSGGGAPTSYSVSPALPSGLSLDPSTGIISGTPAAVTASATYTVTASNSCGSTTKAVTIAITSTGSWLGVTSTNWFDPTNWGCGNIPLATTDVTIPAVGTPGVTYQPAIGAAGAVCHGITINGTLTMSGAFNLDVYGDWTNNGTFTPSTSSITFRGGTNNTMAGSSATTFSSLIINKSGTANTLTSTTRAFTAASLTVTQGDLVMQSTDANYTVTGDINVPANGILTHSANWDTYGKLLSVGGNINIDGIFNYTTRSHVQMTGAAKTVRTGNLAGSAFSIFTLTSTGNISASGTVTINDNFWAMFGSAGSFSTSTFTVNANSTLLSNNGTVSVNGGTLNVTGGMNIGTGTGAVCNLSLGTLNVDNLNIGDGSVVGTFNHSGGTANIGNLTISTTGTYTCTNSPVINITGNWTNNKTFTPSTSQVNFNGTAAQIIAGSVATVFNNLSVNNAAGVTLSISPTVNSILNLSSGLITTGANTITVVAAGTITGGSASSYVNGKLARGFAAGAGSKVFPIGTGGNYRPLTFTYTASSATSVITAQQFESAITGTVTPSTVNIFNSRYWEITKTGAGTVSYTVTLDPTGWAPSGIVYIVKKEGTSSSLTANPTTTPNYTNSTPFPTFNNTASGTNDFALGADCSSSANAGSVLPAICQGGTTVALGGSVSGTATGGTWSSSAGGTFSPSATNYANATWTPPAGYSGSATLTLTPTGGICSPAATSSKTQVVNAPPVINSQPANTSACAGGSSVSFSVGLSSGTSPSYQWQYSTSATGPWNTASDGTTGNFTFSGSTTSTFTITVGSGQGAATYYTRCIITVTGCTVLNSNTATLTINVNSTIALSSATGTDGQTVCQNTAITPITYTIGGGGTGASLTSGSFPPGISGVYSSGTFTISGTPTTAASGTYNYTITTSGPCVNPSATGSITVNAIPSGTLTETDNSGTANNDSKICAGDIATFKFSVSGLGSYIFKVNGVQKQSGTSNVFSSNTLNNGDAISVDVANGSNCGATFGLITMTVSPLPTPTLSAMPSTPICAGTNVTFTAGGGTSYNFKINGSSVQSGASNTYSTTTLTNGASVTVDVTNANGCVATSSAVIITVNPAPSGTLTSTSTTICAGGSITFTGTPGFSNYNFKVNGISAQSNSSNTFTTTTLTNGQVITLDVTNSSGCTATFPPAIPVTVNPAPTGTLAATENSGTSNDNTICQGATVTFTATSGFANYKFYIDGSSTPAQNGSSNVYTNSTLSNGDVISVVVSNSGGCSATFNTQTITVIAPPSGNITASSTTICAGDNIDFTATPGFANYNFKINGTSFQNGSSNTASYSGFTVNSTVTVDVSNTQTCTTTFGPLSITVNPLPTGTLVPVESSGLAANDSIICTGANVVFTATSGYSNYNFKLNGTTVQYTASNTYSNNTLVNGDKITVEVTNASGCIASFNSATITVNPLPTVAAITGLAAVCVGNSTPFTDATSNGTWSSSDNTIATVDASGNVTGVTAGTATISYTATNINGCSTTVTKTITVNALPTVAPITGNFNICTGTTSPLSDATSGGTWSSSDNTIATVDNTGLVTGVSSGTAVISYTVTDANGCSTTTTASLSVSTSPTVAPITTTAPSFDVCAGSGITLKDVTSGGTWSSSDNTIATVSASGVVTGVAAGSVTISYTITTTCNTTVSATQTVAVHPLPTATVSGGTSVCQGSSPAPVISFTGAAGTAPYTFVYNINGGSNQTITTTSGNSITVTAPTGTAGTFTYNLISVADSYGCSQAQSGSTVITVNPSPTATISGTTSVCINGTANITFTGANGTAPYIFTYNINGGLNQIATSVGNTATVPVVTTAAGTYIYNLISVQDGSTTLCTSTTTGSATVTVTPASIGGLVSANATVCAGSNTGTLTLSGNTGNVINWQYSTDNGTTWLNVSPTNITTSLTYTNLMQTTQYRAVVQSGNCSSANSAAATITVNPASVGGTVASNATVCTGSNSGTLTLSGNTGSVIRWEFSVNGGTSWTTVSPSNTTTSLTYNNLTQTTLYRAVVQSGVCSSANSAAATITVSPLPTATISGTANVCQNATAPTITFTGANGIAPYTFIYKINSGTNQTVTSTGNTATVIQSTATVGTYTYTLVSVSSTAGCTQNQGGTATVTVNAPPAAFILTPSSATPVCQGSIQPLTATANTSAPGSVTVSSGNINLAIPDATGFIFITPGSITSNLAVSTVPAGAVINSISVNFNITHTYDNDLVLNLKAPNGKVLNLVDQEGGSGDNFTNTIVSSTGTNPFTNVASAAPFTGTFAPDADNGVGTPNSGNNTFASLFNTPNGTWTFGAEDDGPGDVGKIVNWSITINYTVPNSALPVTWSPLTDLFTDAGATTAYTGTSLSTVYAKPLTSGTKTYTATASNAAGCTTSQNVVLTVNPTPVITITADYCAVAGKVQLTANSVPAATSYLWSTGATTSTILVDVAGNYTVTVYSGSSCPGKGTISIANELVTNGNFEGGNVGFTSPPLGANQYQYRADVAGNNELVPEGLYGVGTDGQNYHPNFWGHDHTTGTGNFMIINGFPNGNPQPIAWQETVSVLPNTTYYFSAWGMSLNNVGPFAQLQFNVNGAQVGSVATLASGVNNNSNNGWTRFYGTLTTGPTTTSAIISITDLQNSPGGNDFGLDDISFSTLSTFVDLQSAAGTDAQTVCVNNSITNIVYSAGTGSSAPNVTGLPAGVTASWNGSLETISGTPTVAGNYSYSVTTTGTCQPFTATGTITVQQQTIALNSGSASPTVCMNSAMSNIIYAIGGSGTGAGVTGLPAGVTGTYNSGSKTFTLSGTPTVAGTFNYTITTTGTCTAATATGTITVQNQTIALNTGSSTQTVCVNNAISGIIYTVSGSATGAGVTGLPTGVSGFYSGGSFIISGTPATSGTFNYTVTTTGTCNPGAVATGTITVNPDASIALSSASGTDNQTICANSPLTAITYNITGSGSGASITSGSLPTGVTGTYSSGIFTISGTPTVTGTFNYTVTATGTCASTTISGTITVQSSSITLTTGTASPTLCLGSSLTPIVFTVGGGASGASITSGSLPAGVTGSYSGSMFTISGSPTALGTFNYTVTNSGGCTPAAYVNGTITVNNGTVGGSLPATVSTCSGVAGTLNLTGQTGTVQHWESSTDGGTTWTTIGNTSTTLPYNITVPTQFRALLKSGSCASAYSSISFIGIHNLWTGVTSTDWNTASNWSDNQVASVSCTTVIIPTGAPHAPQLTSNVTIPGINIASGTTVDLNGHTITVNGSFSGTGTLTGSITSGLIINGSAGMVNFTQTAGSNILQTLKINSGGSATLGNALNVTAGSSPGTVTTNGTLTSNGNLTLKSDYNGTASVGPSTGTISGDVTVERFIPARRAWRFMAVPFNSSSQTISQAWQEGAANPDINTRIDPHPGYGTEITYDNNAAHGFDVNTTVNPSLKTWVQSLQDWTTAAPYTNSTNIAAYDAYCLFVRGSRAVNLSLAVGATTDNTVLRIKGLLNETGVAGNGISKSFGSVTNGTGLFMGNPYASSVDVTSILARSSGVNPNVFYVWDPALSGPGTYNVGGYVSYSNGIWSPSGSGSYPTGSGNPAIIQSGQAFIAVGDGSSTNASVQFKQTDKSTTQAMVFGSITKKPEAHPVIYANLMVPSGNTLILADGVASGFGEGFSAKVDGNDAQKFANFDENMMLERNGANLAIEFRPIPVISDTLFYKLYLRHQPYVLKIFSQQVSTKMPGQAWLIDKYLNTKTTVNLNDTTLYNFTANTDTNSYRNRFMLVFKRTLKATPVATTMSSGGVEATTLEGSVSIYPNPVITGGKVLLKFNNMKPGKYEVTVNSLEGKALTKKTIQHPGGDNSYDMQLDARWATGNYIVKITGENEYTSSDKLVIGK